MITINKVKIYSTGRVDIDKTILGRQNEKKVTKLVFEIPEELDGYNKTIEFLFNGEKVSDVIFNNEYLIDNNVSCHLDLSFQVIFTDSEGNEVFKSDMQPVRFEKSINAVDPVPSAEEVSIYNSLITALKETTEGIENININAVKDGTITTLTITKADGTKESYQVKDGDTYEITDKDYEEIEEQVKVDIQPLLNDINETSDNALEIAKTAENIAKGKSASIVKDTFEEMEQWLKDVANKGTHNIGDNLYIKEMWIDEEAGIRQPDYWITEVLDEPNELGYYYNISDLGVEHPDLTDFLEKDEIKEKYLLITYEDGTTETVKLVVYK